MQGRVHSPNFEPAGDEVDQDLATGAVMGGAVGGGMTPAELQSAELQGAELQDSSYHDGNDALAAIEALWANGNTPSANDIVRAVHECTVEQRTELAQDTQFIDRVIDACTAATLPTVLQSLFEQPKWMLYHYACRKQGSDTDIVRRMIGLGTLEQRKEIVGWNEVTARVAELFGTEHPDNVLGADLGAEIGAGWLDQAALALKAPAYFLWRLATEAVDVAKMWAELAANADALKAGLTGDESTWTKLMAHSPHGAALDEQSRQHLDHIALTMTTELSVEQLRDAFEVRFNHPLIDDSALGENTGFSYTHEHIRAMWEQLSRLPPEQVNQHAIRRTAVFDMSGSGYGGWHAWMLSGAWEDGQGFGDMAIGHGGGNPDGTGLQDPGNYEYYQHTIRHEVGHAVDIQVGGFENFSATCNAKWKRYHEVDSIIDEFIEACGGDEVLKAAAEAFMNSTDPAAAATWNTAVDEAERRGALTASAANVKFALPNLKTDGGVVSNPRADVGGRKFLHRYGSEYMSYATAGEDAAGITSYAYSAWPEFFAEIYAKWFAGTPPNYERGSKLPGWVASQGFGQLVGDVEPTKEEVDKKLGEGKTPRLGGKG